jgi:hypothetical protein
VSVYDLIPSTDEQLDLFSSPTHAVSEASDKINNRWGEFVITPALMMGMDDIILDRIAFGGVKELEEIFLRKLYNTITHLLSRVAESVSFSMLKRWVLIGLSLVLKGFLSISS